MSKRLKQRKVTLVLSNRNTTDPTHILQAVEDVFRPKELELVIDNDVSHNGCVPDEQLETEANVKVAASLDERAKTKTSNEHRPQIISPEMLESFTADYRNHQILKAKQKRKDLESFVVEHASKGILIFLKVVSSLSSP